jgi:hypothetical protein
MRLVIPACVPGLLTGCTSLATQRPPADVLIQGGMVYDGARRRPGWAM